MIEKWHRYKGLFFECDYGCQIRRGMTPEKYKDCNNCEFVMSCNCRELKWEKVK